MPVRKRQFWSFSTNYGSIGFGVCRPQWEGVVRADSRQTGPTIHGVRSALKMAENAKIYYNTIFSPWKLNYKLFEKKKKNYTNYLT